MINLDPSDFAKLSSMVGEYGSLDAVIAALQTGGRPRRTRPAVPFRDAGQVLAAVELRVINREEARKLLGMPKRKARAHPSPPPG